MKHSSGSDPLDFYRRQGPMTDPGRYAALFAELPTEIGALACVAQGLYLHEHMVADYGVTLSAERRSEVHIRQNAARLARLLSHDAGPLSFVRPPEARLVANCRHFSVLLVGALRAQGVPARARCGFGSYFEPGLFIDHWVCEYWSEAAGRWVMVDSQIDDPQRAKFGIDFDLLDVPHDRFLTGGESWAMCRAGKADPASFGILDMFGLWFVAGNLMRDLAALNNMEMLPWDGWGAMPEPGKALGEDQLVFFDRLAEITRNPDAASSGTREIYSNDDRVRVPKTVFNAVLNTVEAV